MTSPAILYQGLVSAKSKNSNAYKYALLCS